MREARRVDLRNGVNAKRVMTEEEALWGRSLNTRDRPTATLDQSLGPSSPPCPALPCPPLLTARAGDIRMNADLLEILERAMYEITPREMGNWGRSPFSSQHRSPSQMELQWRGPFAHPTDPFVSWAARCGGVPGWVCGPNHPRGHSAYLLSCAGDSSWTASLDTLL
jgi:hypothetical protein